MVVPPQKVLRTLFQMGLALMRREHVPAIAHWNQDLEFTANIGTPGEARTREMRQEAFDRNSRVRSDNIEFAVIQLASRELIGFGGLFDISRALTATLFGIGEGSLGGRGYGTRRPASSASTASSSAAFTTSRWRSTATT